MKKTIKALWLLLIAATIFTGCSFGNSAAEETAKTKEEKSKEENLCKALFSTSNTKVKTFKFELEDGKWTFREWSKDTDTGRNESINVSFTLTDGKTDLDKKMEIIHQVKYTKDIPSSVVEKLKKEGYDKYTDQHWYKKTSDKDKIKEIAALDIVYNSEDVAKYNNLSDFEKAIFDATHDIPENGDTRLVEFKTNSEKNKYYWEPIALTKTYSYLMKD